MDRIDNSVLSVTAWHNEALQSDAKQYLRDRIVYPVHKSMFDSFSYMLLGASPLINPFLPLITLHLCPPS